MELKPFVDVLIVLLPLLYAGVVVLYGLMNKLLWYAWHVVKQREFYDAQRWRELG